MQLSTTVIKHKRYSTYGWNLQSDGIYKNTLAQGEIGVLLGHQYYDDKLGQLVSIPIEHANSGKELNCILEVRIGTQDKQQFFKAMLLNSKDNVDLSIKQYLTQQKFPSFGNSSSLYIETSTNTIFRWDDQTTSYVALGSSGSGNNGNLSNYYTKAEINALMDSLLEEILSIEMIDGGDCRGQSSVNNI